MQIFIGNLPGEATLTELQGFLGSLHVHSTVEYGRGCDFQALDYHYFVIRADTRAMGKRLIQQFDGHSFHGRQVEAREYIQRTPSGWSGEERRINSN